MKKKKSFIENLIFKTTKHTTVNDFHKLINKNSLNAEEIFYLNSTKIGKQIIFSETIMDPNRKE